MEDRLLEPARVPESEVPLAPGDHESTGFLKLTFAL